MNININSNNDNNIHNMTRVKKREKNSDRVKERKKIAKNGDH